MIPSNITSEQIQVFLLAFVRIASIISLLPFLGSQAVPMQLKAGFSIFIAILLFPNIPLSQTHLALNLPGFVFMVVKEIFVGITIGYSTTIIFAIIQFGGRLIDTQIGFALVEIIDPFSEVEVTVTGQFQVLIYSILFLSINAHYFLLIAVQKSFEIIPLFGAQMPSGNVASHLISMVGDIFVLAVRISAPVLGVLILTELALGIIARTVPQLNVFFVGLPLKIFLGIVTMIITLPLLAKLFQSLIQKMMADIWQLLYMLA